MTLKSFRGWGKGEDNTFLIFGSLLDLWNCFVVDVTRNNNHSAQNAHGFRFQVEKSKKKKANDAVTF